jgi:pimeloyl-ACP methyl ester carboxylesterase
MTKWLAYFSLALLAGCPSTDVDPGEVGPPGPTAEFDPSNRIVPFPNNLLLDPATGKLDLPAGCNSVDANLDGIPDGGPESATAMALREQVLNQLDGFGAFKTTINVTFTEVVDAASLTGKVHLYRIASGGMPVAPADSDEIAVIATPVDTVRFDASCANPTPVEQITFTPVDVSSGTPVPVPLPGNSTYVLGIEEGVTTMADGTEFAPSFVWALVRSAEDPVTLDANGNVIADRTPLNPSDPEDLLTLQGVDLLWNVHEGPLAFLATKGHAHDTILLATSFNTQTVTASLDAAVTGTPAAAAATTGALAGVTRFNPGANGQQFLQAALPPNSCQVDGGPLPCQNVGEVLVGDLAAKQFQIDTPNPLSGGEMIPGPWSDPIKPAEVRTETIQAIIATPTTSICPASCPTVIFGHGLGQSKTNVFAIASQLATAGFNVVAIDFVAHDSRAVRVSDDPLRGCGGTPSPVTAPQCFAPFLSPNLAGTRDNIRQSVIDLHSLKAAIGACGPSGCGLFSADPATIVYIGQSLGGIMGSTATATLDFKAAALNVPGAGWVDILENTQTVAIKCSLVDSLIDAGILVGDKSMPPGMPTSGLCLGEDWKSQPSYRQFAVIARWVLDPGDPINFTTQLRSKKILIQEVVGDTVVPNVATEQEAALVGLQPGAMADPAAAPPIMPSTAIGMTSVFVRYPTLPAAPPFPGNTFNHGSLLRPANAMTDGQLGTARMQTDAFTFLVLNR